MCFRFQLLLLPKPRAAGQVSHCFSLDLLADFSLCCSHATSVRSLKLHIQIKHSRKSTGHDEVPCYISARTGSPSTSHLFQVWHPPTWPCFMRDTSVQPPLPASMNQMRRLQPWVALSSRTHACSHLVCRAWRSAPRTI